MSAEVKLTTRNALRVLRPGPFRRYIIGSAISDTGTWMQVMTQGWVMATLTTSAFMLGLVQLCAGLPMLALTMIGGSTADKFDKRKILLITQYIQIAIAVSIGLLIWSGKIAIWQIFVFATIQGVSNSFEMPTLSALVPELVKREEIQSAISIDRSVFHGSRVFGPAIGGYLVSACGLASAFFANAISFIALIVAILSLPPEIRVPLMMICATVVTLAVTGLSRAPSFYVAMALLIVNSLGLATNFGLCSTIVQERAPDYLRGRVSAVFMLSFVGLMPIAGLGVTSLSDLIGMPTALVIAAICYGAITLLVLVRIRKQCCEPALSESQAGETPPPIAATI